MDIPLPIKHMLWKAFVILDMTVRHMIIEILAKTVNIYIIMDVLKST